MSSRGLPPAPSRPGTVGSTRSRLAAIMLVEVPLADRLTPIMEARGGCGDSAAGGFRGATESSERWDYGRTYV